jgi:hypothetical protein
MNTHRISNLGDPTSNTDALNRQSADSRYYMTTTALNNILAPTGNLSLNGNKITGLATPTLANDAATKDYVDNISTVSGIRTGTVLVGDINGGTTGSITVSGAITSASKLNN